MYIRIESVRSSGSYLMTGRADLLRYEVMNKYWMERESVCLIWKSLI